MNNKSLSQLVKNYSVGEINEREYREIRTKLIQDIVAGNIILEKNKHIPPIIPADNQEIKKESRNKKRKKVIHLQNKRPLFIAIAVLGTIVVISIISVFILR